MGVVTQGADKYRAAEKQAKEKKVRIWKDYTPSVSTVSLGSVKEKEYTGKVSIIYTSLICLSHSFIDFTKDLISEFIPILSYTYVNGPLAR